VALLDYSSYIVLEPSVPLDFAEVDVPAEVDVLAEVDVPAEVAFDLSFEEGTFAALLKDTGSYEVLVGDFS